jgi:ribosomal-protein-alanine N-acetyltransferase
MFDYVYPDEIESARLITQKLTESHILPWADFFKDKEAIEYFPSYDGTDLERSKSWMERQLMRYTENRYGMQALLDKKSNEFIGQCGLLAQEVDGIAELEVGYHIFKRHWGQGYAPEAARLFINFAFENNLSDSIISIIHVNNLRSQRVADKNGLTREKQTKWLDLDVYIYRINKDNWSNY